MLDTISNDYLDVDSPTSTELLSPMKQVLDNDAVVKSIAVFLHYQVLNVLNGRLLDRQIGCEFDYSTSPQLLDDDFALYQMIKKDIARPPEDEDEAKLSPAELMKERDPEGVFSLPFESKEVQDALAMIRKKDQKYKEGGEFYKVQKAYRSAMKDLRQEHGTIQLSEIEITLIYALRSNLSQEKVAKFKVTN